MYLVVLAFVILVLCFICYGAFYQSGLQRCACKTSPRKSKKEKKLKCREQAQSILGPNLDYLKKCKKSDPTCNRNLWKRATKEYKLCMKSRA